MRLKTQTIKSEVRAAHPALATAPDPSRTRQLRDANKQEVLDFLTVRPVHTVVMTSLINDNGLESSLNRGKFYGYRNAEGTLEGVALIGHTTLVEARSENALKALAYEARASEVPLHLIMSDGSGAETFWNYLRNGIGQPRLICTELLFEISFPFAVQKCAYEIRLAQMSELDQIAEAQAEIAYMECGVNPLQKDHEGFLKRVARRIEQGRVFVVFENGQLVFKADIIAETSEVIYLEGIYVAPSHRGQGLGSACLAKLSVDLLNRVQHISLLSNIAFTDAHTAYSKAGYKKTGSCVTIFV
jgi:GNAT superfamily N-acetyltransferase